MWTESTTERAAVPEAHRLCVCEDRCTTGAWMVMDERGGVEGWGGMEGGTQGRGEGSEK